MKEESALLRATYDEATSELRVENLSDREIIVDLGMDHKRILVPHDIKIWRISPEVAAQVKVQVLGRYHRAQK